MKNLFEHLQRLFLKVVLRLTNTQELIRCELDRRECAAKFNEDGYQIMNGWDIKTETVFLMAVDELYHNSAFPLIIKEMKSRASNRIVKWAKSYDEVIHDRRTIDVLLFLEKEISKWKSEYDERKNKSLSYDQNQII